MGQVFKNWVVSYVGNFVGSLFMVQMVVLTGIFAAAPAAVKIAAAKTSLTFLQVRRGRDHFCCALAWGKLDQQGPWQLD